jgi:hypothetical protein
MISAFSRVRTAVVFGVVSGLVLAGSVYGQTERHGRKYKKLEPAANITLTVEKASNGKPISNAAVVFRAYKNGQDQGSLEVKTNPDGEAKIDIIEIGSHVKVQIIADGFATGATEFDLTGDEKNVTVKMEKPRAQVSTYQNNDGKPAQRPAGIQEPPPIAKPKKAKAPTTGPNAPPAPLTPAPASAPQ